MQHESTCSGTNPISFALTPISRNIIKFFCMEYEETTVSKSLQWERTTFYTTFLESFLHTHFIYIYNYRLTVTPWTFDEFSEKFLCVLSGESVCPWLLVLCEIRGGNAEGWRSAHGKQHILCSLIPKGPYNSLEVLERYV